MGKNKRINKKKMFVAFLVLVAAIVGGFLIYDNTGNLQPTIEELMEKGTFTEGVSVEGTELSGLSFTQAEEKLLLKTEEMAEDFALSVKLEETIHNINGIDINAETTLEDRLKDGIQIGNIGTRRQRRQAKKKTKNEKQNYELKYKYDENLLEQNLDLIYALTGEAATDASVKLVGGKLEYKEGKSGKAINMEKLKEDIQEEIDKGEAKMTVKAEFITQEPKYSVAMLQETLVQKSATSTEFKNSTNDRVANVVKASEMLNGTIVLPGETFSINKVLGARTEENGWSVATGIAGGKYIDDVGGGVCQVSSTLYGSAQKAGLKITQRQPHSFPVAYLPEGQDAAISTGGPDLEFVNNYDFPIYILSEAGASSRKLNIYIYGPRNADNSTIAFKTEKISDEPSSTKAKISENSNLRKGEYVEISPRKNRIEVKRWLEYIIDGKIVKTVELSNDIYAAYAGEYIVGPETEIDEKTGIPKGNKVSEEYLTKERETPTTKKESPDDAPEGNEDDNGNDE